MSGSWEKTACILCECNCGLEVQIGGEGNRHFTRIRGDKAHPSSKGYACEKPHRLDYYQNGPDRITSPLRRRDDGTFEAIDWDTAIREVAARLSAVRDAHGGETIFYYGGGGQGNHLPGAYSTATRRVLGSRYRSSALAQEKTGEFWVGGRLMGNMTRADFEHCEVALFIGKNPWQSHGIPRARVTLKGEADHRLRGREVRRVADRHEFRLVDRGDAVLGRPAAHDVVEVDGVFREVRVGPLVAPGLLGAGQSGRCRGKQQGQAENHRRPGRGRGKGG